AQRAARRSLLDRGADQMSHPVLEQCARDVRWVAQRPVVLVAELDETPDPAEVPPRRGGAQAAAQPPPDPALEQLAQPRLLAKPERQSSGTPAGCRLEAGEAVNAPLVLVPLLASSADVLDKRELLAREAQ